MTQSCTDIAATLPGRRRFERLRPNRKLKRGLHKGLHRGEVRLQPLRVLHVVSTFEVKTDTKWLLLLLRNVDRHQCCSSIACMYGDGPMRNRIESLGVEAANLDSPGETDLRTIGRVYRYIRSGRFDVVHTHLLRADLYAGLAGRLAGVPAVVSTAYAIGKFRRERQRRLDGLLDQLTRLMPHHVVAVSGAVRDDCVRRLRWPADRVSVIHTGIEPDDYRRDEASRRRIRTEWGLAEGVRLIVTVARLSYEKGLPTFIEALVRIARRHPTIVAAIVGEGPMRSELTGRIEVAGLTGRVRLVGFRPDVADVLAAADVFCLPSYMEGLPNVVLEASAAGLPVIASKVGGVPEVVIDERTGLLVPPKSADALATAIDRVVSDTCLARRLAEAGRRRVEECFSAKIAAEKYMTLYRMLVRGRSR